MSTCLLCCLSRDLGPVLSNKLSDHRAPVAAAAFKAASMLMQHTQPGNPAGLVNKLLQQQQIISTSASKQDNSGLLELVILVGVMLKQKARSADTLTVAVIGSAS